MNDIFGIPMTSILLVTVTVMGICLLTVGIIAWRNRVVFRLALRNIPRRKTQTVLIMVGLMLSTLIIAASLTTGDTLTRSVTRSTYDSLGHVDETIGFVGDARGTSTISTESVPISTSTVDLLEERFAGDPDIDGFMPLLTVDAPVANPGSGLGEPSTVITGLDAGRLPAFGGLETPEGEPIDFASLHVGAAVISQSLAESLEASVGDELRFTYQGKPRPFTVGAIARDSILTGYRAETEQAGPAQTTAADTLGIAVPIERLQELTGLKDQARFIAVSNAGGVEEGAGRTESVLPKLEDGLDQIEGGQRLGVNPVKQDALESAEQFGSTFLTFFMLFGTFSMAAGILLIFLIFMMLAAERRSEMGMARAIGMKRRQLVQSFVAEGAMYDLGAALAGAGSGVLLAFAIASALGNLLGDSITVTPYASWRSLVIAYSLGVSVTFITIVFASVRSSRLNIVAAIRDLPDERHPERGRRPAWQWWSRLTGPESCHGVSLSWLLALPLEGVWNVGLIVPKLLIWSLRVMAHYIGWGPLIAVAGNVVMILSASIENYFLFSLGLSVLVLGFALTLRWHLPPRLVYTVAAAFMLLYWLLPFDVTARVLPELGEGGPEMLFISGISMVGYLILIIMWNADLIVWLVSLSGRTFARWLPAVKTAVAYPLASRGRTGLTMAMFSMVVFALVMVATISSNFSELILSEDAAAGWDVLVTTGPSNPIEDLDAELNDSGVNADSVSAVGHVTALSPDNAQVRNDEEGEWKRYAINGMDSRFIEHAEIPLRARARGYESDAAVWDAIQSGEPLAIVDSVAFESDDFGGGGDEIQYAAPEGLSISDGPFPAFQVELQDATTGEAENVTVIGVMDSSVSTLSGFYVAGTTFDDVYGDAGASRFYLQTPGGSDADTAELAREIEAGLDTRGVQAVSIQAQIEENQSFANGFFTLMQGFMGMGLLVGIAALGVIAFRSVVERRQQIGMLRAIGYKREMISASFVIESLIVALLGVLSGVGLAIVLAYNLVSGGELGEDFDRFIIPWTTILLFVIAALVAALVMTWIPARKASAMPIAEALRYE